MFISLRSHRRNALPLRLPVSHIVMYQRCATFITEAQNVFTQIDHMQHLRSTQVVDSAGDRHTNSLIVLF